MARNLRRFPRRAVQQCVGPVCFRIQFNYAVVRVYHLYEPVVTHQSVIVSIIFRYWGTGDLSYNSCTSYTYIHTCAMGVRGLLCNRNNAEQEQTDDRRHYCFTDNKFAKQFHTQQTPELNEENLSDTQNDCQTVTSNTKIYGVQYGVQPLLIATIHTGVKLASPSTDFHPCPQINR